MRAEPRGLRLRRLAVAARRRRRAARSAASWSRAAAGSAASVAASFLLAFIRAVKPFERVHRLRIRRRRLQRLLLRHDGVLRRAELLREHPVLLGAQPGAPRAGCRRAPPPWRRALSAPTVPSSVLISRVRGAGAGEEVVREVVAAAAVVVLAAVVRRWRPSPARRRRDLLVLCCLGSERVGARLPALGELGGGRRRASAPPGVRW